MQAKGETALMPAAGGVTQNVLSSLLKEEWMLILKMGWRNDYKLCQPCHKWWQCRIFEIRRCENCGDGANYILTQNIEHLLMGRAIIGQIWKSVLLIYNSDVIFYFFCLYQLVREYQRRRVMRLLVQEQGYRHLSVTCMYHLNQLYRLSNHYCWRKHYTPLHLL